MKKIFKVTLSFILLICTNSYGQNKYNEVIISEANKMISSLKEKDYQTLINDYTYPKLLELSGGNTNMLNQITTQIKRMEDGGARISDVAIGEPKKIFVAGDELHCLVPQKLVLKVPKGKVITNSFLLAISRNNGEKWYFLDTNQLDPVRANQLFPEFNQDLQLPEKRDPTFIPD
ncbi:hypothetical protein ACWGOQ_0023705 [Aquimarina sp. M1]